MANCTEYVASAACRQMRCACFRHAVGSDDHAQMMNFARRRLVYHGFAARVAVRRG
jgi:hypothetical protein